MANVNTPGYSRESPILVTSDPVVVNPLTFGSGVTLQSIESIRDPILEGQIQQQTQSQNQYSALTSALQQTQVSFTTNSGDIGTSISNFFDSINQLSTDPADLSLRQSVLTAANNLTDSFNTTANNLTQQQGNLDLNVVQQVGRGQSTDAADCDAEPAGKQQNVGGCGDVYRSAAAGHRPAFRAGGRPAAADR